MISYPPCFPMQKPLHGLEQTTWVRRGTGSGWTGKTGASMKTGLETIPMATSEKTARWYNLDGGMMYPAVWDFTMFVKRKIKSSSLNEWQHDQLLIVRTKKIPLLSFQWGQPSWLFVVLADLTYRNLSILSFIYIRLKALRNACTFW